MKLIDGKGNIKSKTHINLLSVEKRNLPPLRGYIKIANDASRKKKQVECTLWEMDRDDKGIYLAVTEVPEAFGYYLSDMGSAIRHIPLNNKGMIAIAQKFLSKGYTIKKLEFVQGFEDREREEEVDELLYKREILKAMQIVMEEGVDIKDYTVKKDDIELILYQSGGVVIYYIIEDWYTLKRLDEVLSVITNWWKELNKK